MSTMLSDPWFASLPPPLQTTLVGASTIKTLASGQRLLTRGDAADGLYCILDGRMRATTITSSGDEVVLAVVEAPHWLGEIALFDGLSRTHDVWAETSTTLLHVPSSALQDLLQEHPEYWHAFGRLMAQRIREAFAMIEDASLRPPLPRLASRLLAMTRGYVEGKPLRLCLYVRQEQLASMLGLSRQTVNQLLKQLEADSVISLHRGSVEITDSEKLRQYAHQHQ